MEPLPPRIRGLEPLSRRFEAPIHDIEELEFRFTPEGAKS